MFEYFFYTNSASSHESDYLLCLQAIRAQKQSFFRRGLAPYKKIDNPPRLRASSHESDYLFFCMACSFRECSQRESNPQLALRRFVISKNVERTRFSIPDFSTHSVTHSIVPLPSLIYILISKFSSYILLLRCNMRKVFSIVSIVYYWSISEI